jgi:hypothetical protein
MVFGEKKGSENLCILMWGRFFMSIHATKINFLLVGSFLFTHACRGLDQNVSKEYAVTSGINFVEQNLSPLEKNSDVIFRDLFAWHYMREGANVAAVEQAVFLTPPGMKQVPVTQDPGEFFDALGERSITEKPVDWYTNGVKNPPKPRTPRTPQKPITVVVVPGIFGEFIKNYPFHEIVTNKSSVYHQKWQKLLEGSPDEFFSLTNLKPQSSSLGDLIKIGSYDVEGRPWVQVAFLEAKLGSLETLGTLTSAIPIYKRRLNKFFNIVKDDGDIYVMGYSRGTAVALELVRQVSEESSQHPWAGRIKGIIGLGGVFYGTKIADDAINSKESANGKMVAIISQLVNDLKVDEQALQGKTSLQSASFMAHNTKAWGIALKDILQLQLSGGGGKDAQDPVKLAFASEQKLRSQKGSNQRPDLFGLASLVQDFAFDLLKRDCPWACYFNNVASFKLLMTKVIEGVSSLTVEARLKWWREYRLPAHLQIFSIVGTMPDATKDNKLSLLFNNPNYGASMVDYNAMLRSSFYGVFGIEKTELNDSQVSYARSRYWSSAFSDRSQKHYYLGVMGTHHWGFSFPFAIKNADQSANPFPRSALMATIASFIEELRAEGASRAPSNP